MILSTERLKLRPWRTGDEASLVLHANNREVSRNLRDRFPFPYTHADALAWIAHASGALPQTAFAIEVDGLAVGGIAVMLGSDVFSRTAELGYWLGQSHWGKGLMSEAVSLVVPWALRQFDLTRLHAGVFDWNPASGRVLEKSGFTLESRMRKAVVKDGQVLDQLMYVFLR